MRSVTRGWAELVGMSGGGTETPTGCEAPSGGGGGGGRKRDSVGTTSSPAHLIIKGMNLPGGTQRSLTSQARPLIWARTPG